MKQKLSGSEKEKEVMPAGTMLTVTEFVSNSVTLHCLIVQVVVVLENHSPKDVCLMRINCKLIEDSVNLVIIV